MDFIQLLLFLTQVILINSEKCSNKSELCGVDNEKELNLGFYEVPQITHYEEGGIWIKLSALLKLLNFHIFLEIGTIVSGKFLKNNPPFELSNVHGVSEECRKDSEKFVASLKKIELWALQSE